MNLPDIDTHHRIDALTLSSYSFALYRLPWTDDCCGVFQTSGSVEELDDIACLNDKKGFVIAPFSHSKEHPLVLIRPDLTTYGWNDIRKTTLSFMENDAGWHGKAPNAEQYEKARAELVAALAEKEGK